MSEPSDGAAQASSERGPSGPVPQAPRAGKMSEPSDGAAQASSERGPSGPVPQAPRAEKMSEPSDGAAQASSERGPSGPVPQAPRAEKMSQALLMGAVAYDPKVVTIWEGFRKWFARQNFAFDYVLYSNYERQVEDLIAGRIDAAWNSPLAWVRSVRLGRAAGIGVEPLTMRDTDCDLTSVVVVPIDSAIETVADLKGAVVATGAVDSPQATLIPLLLLTEAGLTPGDDVTIRRFNVGVGLHGDHVGGERDAARALTAGEVQAACMIDANHLQFTNEGTLPRGGTRIIGQTAPYDHCNMTVTVNGPREMLVRFDGLLRAMDYSDPVVRPLLDLEGLRRWVGGRTSGYAQLEQAVNEGGFYDDDGRVTANEYRP